MQYENQKLIAIDKAELPSKAAQMLKEGYRLVQVCCVNNASGNSFEITYSFDRAYELMNVRVQVSKDDAVVPSITDQYLAAFTYENELQDLFGLKVPGMKLNFNGNFYRLSVPTPFATVAAPKSAAPAAGATQS